MSDLYEADILAWSEHQAALLRRLATGERVNHQIDWANVVEEIESVGRSERMALASRVRVILEHLAKLQVSPATAPRAGWRESIRQARAAVAELLEASPSLRQTLPEVVAREMPRAKVTGGGFTRRSGGSAAGSLGQPAPQGCRRYRHLLPGRSHSAGVSAQRVQASRMRINAPRTRSARPDRCGRVRRRHVGNSTPTGAGPAERCWTRGVSSPGSAPPCAACRATRSTAALRR